MFYWQEALRKISEEKLSILPYTKELRFFFFSPLETTKLKD